MEHPLRIPFKASIFLSFWLTQLTTSQGVAVENTEIPLHLAAMQGSTEMCALLIKYGADVNKRDGRGWTPLHVACAFAREVELNCDEFSIPLLTNVE